MKKTIFFLTLSVFLFTACQNDDDLTDDCNQPDACSLVPETGPCLAYIPKYFFNEKIGQCEEFIWGGCEGVVPFDTMEECEVCLCNN